MNNQQIHDKINQQMQTNKSIIIAIDGNSAAGKSTLAQQLQSKYPCNLFHMDDFFLRPEQRTPERLYEPGGNIDYERFKEEVLTPLKSGIPFSYRPYDCQTEELSTPVTVNPKQLNIVEGVYSMHPRFIEAYDLKIFLSLDKEEQNRRLQERNPGLYERFMQEWIPMENSYFEHYRIAEKCDFDLVQPI